MLLEWGHAQLRTSFTFQNYSVAQKRVAISKPTCEWYLLRIAITNL